MTTPHDSTGIDALVRAIEALQERIRNDGDTIGSNEIRTRTALVDPLLTALGWDTTDPAMVIPEYAAGGGTADYALLKVTPDGGSPVIAFIEAKRLHEPLEPHRAQMLTYANMSGVKYAGLTNGDRWELYEVFKEAPLHERRLVDVSLRWEPAVDCAVQLLPLRWPSLEADAASFQDGAQSLLLHALNVQASPRVVAILLDKGANTNLKLRDGRTLLHWTVRNAKTETIAALIDHGADIEARDHSGMTPLYYAVTCNSKAIALLLDWGADIEAAMNIGWRPLHCAASKSNAEVVALLLDRGADIDARDDIGSVPLHWAARSRNSSHTVIELLISYGANVHATDNNGRTPLHYALENPDIANPEVVSLLLAHGADIDATTHDGWTPLHTLVRYGMPHYLSLRSRVCIMKELIGHGIDITAVTNDGKTPYQLAAEHGADEEILRLLRV